MSATSLSKLISTRKEELARLLEWRGTNFPVVERQNDLRISFIELELEDLEKLNNQPQLSENQQIVLEWLKLQAPTAKPMQVIFWMMNNAAWGKLDELRKPIMHLTDIQQAQVLEEFGKWVQEQEEE